jgi:hypothetical protein
MQLDQYRVFTERSLADLEVGWAYPRGDPLPGRASRQLGPAPPRDRPRPGAALRRRLGSRRGSARLHRKIGNEGSRPRGSSLRPSKRRSIMRRPGSAHRRLLDAVPVGSAARERGTTILSPPQSVPGGRPYPLRRRVVEARSRRRRSDRLRHRRRATGRSSSTAPLVRVARHREPIHEPLQRADADRRGRPLPARGRGVDPEIPNWLDTRAGPTGWSYRYVWSSDAPVPPGRVVKTASLRAHLPAFTPTFAAAERRGQIARRRRAIARRFRR